MRVHSTQGIIKEEDVSFLVHSTCYTDTLLLTTTQIDTLRYKKRRQQQKELKCTKMSNKSADRAVDISTSPIITHMAAVSVHTFSPISAMSPPGRISKSGPRAQAFSVRS